MPRLIPFRLAVACALALVLALSISVAAAAKGVSADLRVVGAGGKVLAEETLKTGTTKIPTSKKATCFGKGTGGSGKAATVRGATAFGLLGQAAKSNSALKPLLVSDSFDFGLALCGVGGSVASSKASWYLKVNHKNPEIGGEQVKLHKGDEVLWALVSYPYPDELSLEAPEEVAAGAPFTVKVYSYNEKGKRKPAAGVKVSGASEPTGPEGTATVTLAQPTVMVAKHGKDIPSNAVPVCVSGVCP
jgi:hypothetical protein